MDATSAFLKDVFSCLIASFTPLFEHTDVFLEAHLKLFLIGNIHVLWAFTVVSLKSLYASVHKKKALKYLYEYFKILADSF